MMLQTGKQRDREKVSETDKWRPHRHVRTHAHRPAHVYTHSNKRQTYFQSHIEIITNNHRHMNEHKQTHVHMGCLFFDFLAYVSIIRPACRSYEVEMVQLVLSCRDFQQLSGIFDNIHVLGGMQKSFHVKEHDNHSCKE